MMFLREVQVRIDQSDYSDWHTEFRVEFDATDEDPALGTVEIYNLSRDRANGISKGQSLVLNAGYQEDIGTLLAGQIVDVASYKDGTERITEIEVVDATQDWLDKPVVKTYAPGTTSSQILQDLLNLSGLEVGRIDLPNDLVYVNGRSVSSTIARACRQMALDGGADLYINNGSAFVVPRDFSQDVGVMLDKDSGLVSVERVDRDDAEWLVESLLNFRIRAGAQVLVRSPEVSGVFRVVRGTHLATDQEFLTQLEVAE